MLRAATVAVAVAVATVALRKAPLLLVLGG
jgi:hypothetical protein